MNAAESAAPADEPSVPVTAAERSERPAIPARHFQWFFATHVLIASVASFFLVLQGASDEPYVSFRASDAFSQIGFGCVLIAIWLYLIVGALYGVATSRLSSWWLLLPPWAAIVLFYVSVCPRGFIEDIVRYALKP